ncbi:MAG: dTDP-4-dehydrorhamnose reductase [Thermodesulfobacteriota bacterium]
MRIIVTGYPGLLSLDLVPILQAAGHEVVPFTIGELDITGKEAVFRTLENIAPEVLINCAGYTAVDQAEGEWEAVFRANTLGVHHLALACDLFKIVLCQISTDYIFDGQKRSPYLPWDLPQPLNVYGASKLAAEFLVEKLLNRFYIVRTSSLYGKHGNNFVRTILEKAGEGNPLSIVCDQMMSPTWSVNLSQGLLRIIDSGNFGVYHVSDRTEGGVSWYDFAQAVFKIKGLEQEIIPLYCRELNRPAPRPSYSVLDTRYLTMATGYEPLHFQEALERFLND